ncbi:DUF4670 domain-containing protein [Patescibacteria group bacterium AH-259-L05]|nr:DUF4670 domain-containing protein [Patescibacteria group bacterium AH-259-L05]
MHIPAILPPNPLEELERNKKMAELKQLTKKEQRQLRKQKKIEERKRAQRRQQIKKIVNITILVLFIGGGLFALIWFSLTASKLPPTTMEGHIEQSPPRHILNQPMAEVIQKHMLEHADGGGRSGVIIQYNCDTFECEPDLIKKLTDLVKQYPDNVYLAPNNYDGKIILTKLGRKKILNEFDEEAIRNFIE